MLLKYFATLVCLAISSVACSERRESCEANLVETVPTGVKFEEEVDVASIYDSFQELIRGAESSIQIAAFYWAVSCTSTLEKTREACSRGNQMTSALIEALKRRVRVQIAINGTEAVTEVNEDLKTLKSHGAEIVILDFSKILGTGILHTKFVISDEKNFFLGSANMAWRALGEVKEIGLHVRECPVLTKELQKIFKIYWNVGVSGKIPNAWPQELQTQFNMGNPMKLKLSGHNVRVFLSHSPPQMTPSGWTSDVDAVLNALNSAESFIGIEVMNYSPEFYMKGPWPVLDDALRKIVAENPVTIRMLTSKWKFVREELIGGLQSLNRQKAGKKGGNMSVKMISIPEKDNGDVIDEWRLNHCKFVVTDKLFYIGTSNWAGDYFMSSGGVGLTVIYEDENSQPLREKLERVFDRDWNFRHTEDVGY